MPSNSRVPLLDPLQILIGFEDLILIFGLDDHTHFKLTTLDFGSKSISSKLRQNIGCSPSRPGCPVDGGSAGQGARGCCRHRLRAQEQEEIYRYLFVSRHP